MNERRNETLNPLLLLFILACIALPQMDAGFGRNVRVPPALVLQLETKSDKGQYTALDLSFSFVGRSGDAGRLFLVPRRLLKLPDASRGSSAGPGMMRWEQVLQMN